MLLCSNCGYKSPVYLEKCPGCFGKGCLLKEPIGIAANDFPNENKTAIYKTGFSGLDDLLGGGLTPSRSYLLYGQPGIGKTTLLLQILATIQRGEGEA